jgi:prophage maintenance system killer protein
MAIETGVIEGIYRIERGITELLIDRGIETALIPHGSTDHSAEEIVSILQEHHGTLEGIFAFISQQRQLSVSYVRELHQQLCASQDRVLGVDPYGRRSYKPLRKGDWKVQPNNPNQNDGAVHEYCPPEHVASEMESLIAFYRRHQESQVAPEVEAAWLHHRFTQIHPFEDGNGRVARALASLILIQADLFPFIVDRDEQAHYLSALKIADLQDDLRPLIRMIARQQQNTLLAALDLSGVSDAEPGTADSLDHTLAAAAARLHVRQDSQLPTEFQLLEARILELVSLCMEKLTQTAQQFAHHFEELSNQFQLVALRSVNDHII